MSEQKPDILHTINEKIMSFPYVTNIETHHRVHSELNAFYLQMRQEIYNLQKMHVKSRANKIKELYRQDFLQEINELEEVGLGYIHTQP